MNTVEIRGAKFAEMLIRKDFVIETLNKLYNKYKVFDATNAEECVKRWVKIESEFKETYKDFVKNR